MHFPSIRMESTYSFKDEIGVRHDDLLDHHYDGKGNALKSLMSLPKEGTSRPLGGRFCDHDRMARIASLRVPASMAVFIGRTP